MGLLTDKRVFVPSIENPGCSEEGEDQPTGESVGSAFPDLWFPGNLVLVFTVET